MAAMGFPSATAVHLSILLALAWEGVVGEVSQPRLEPSTPTELDEKMGRLDKVLHSLYDGDSPSKKAQGTVPRSAPKREEAVRVEGSAAFPQPAFPSDDEDLHAWYVGVEGSGAAELEGSGDIQEPFSYTDPDPITPLSPPKPKVEEDVLISETHPSDAQPPPPAKPPTKASAASAPALSSLAALLVPVTLLLPSLFFHLPRVLR